MLLIIPGELRNRINFYLLSYDLPIRIHSEVIGSETKPQCMSKTAGSHYSLALTCRQAYQEALGLVFTYNALEFHTKTSLRSALQTFTDFIRSQPSTAHPFMRKITILDTIVSLPALGEILTDKLHSNVHMFYAENPQARVILRLDDPLDISTIACLYQSLTLSAWRAALRDEDITILPGPTKTMMHKDIRDVTYQFSEFQFHGKDCEGTPVLQACVNYLNTVPEPLRMALRDETLAAFPEKHWGNTLGPWDHEREDMEAVLWFDADKRNLLSNYRVTLTSTLWGEDMRPQERGLAERLFEGSC
ncbi:hypothetical protein E8E11_004557 [Didymella keratinophila]|nr:hypothetical protein E8E11_004557 [Didymella keratinophila]